MIQHNWHSSSLTYPEAHNHCTVRECFCFGLRWCKVRAWPRLQTSVDRTLTSDRPSSCWMYYPCFDKVACDSVISTRYHYSTSSSYARSSDYASASLAEPNCYSSTANHFIYPSDLRSSKPPSHTDYHFASLQTGAFNLHHVYQQTYHLSSKKKSHSNSKMMIWH